MPPSTKICLILGIVCAYLLALLVVLELGFGPPGDHTFTSKFQTSEYTQPAVAVRPRGLEYGIAALRPPAKRSKIEWCGDLRFVDPPREPVALASFPGSGNTWLRYLLQQATGFYTGSVYKDYGLLKNGFPAESVANGSVLVVKTHEWGASARRPFAKAVLLVRAPAAAIQAEFNRQSGGHVGFASADRYRRNRGKHWLQFVEDKLRAWRSTNLDWLRNFTGPTHVVFYEQMTRDVAGALRAVLEFVGGGTGNAGPAAGDARVACALRRREGIYRRRRRALAFDPFTEEMRRRIRDEQARVYDEIYAVAAIARRRRRR